MYNLAKLDICFIAGTLGQGGAERQLFYIIKSLKESGARIRLLCLTKGEFWESRIRALGVPIIWVGQHGGRAVRLFRIIKTLREQPSQIVQSQHFYTNLYASLSARALGACEIGAMRSNGASEVLTTGAILGRLSLRLPRMIAANSQTAIDNARALGIATTHLHLLPNVVDTEQFQPTERQMRGHIRLIIVGRLVEEKRVDRFLTILQKIKGRSEVNVRGVIVGDGPLRQVLEQRAADLGLLPDEVEFRGSVSDTTKVYQEADIMILASEYEGTPNVLLEAMSSGLPVVATSVGGVPEIIRHKDTGMLADAADESSIVESLTESLLVLVNNSRLRLEMGQRARKYILANHSPDKLTERLATLYGAVLV